ncbi:GNAT family N-acetyltransferase [uncultured Friedmanniella sp.]|uniref:GNAT family N-acetyltransferase n=1 Tax=uncultured Friedmanniella sp. TaxID=335381 RepID=UPI0035CBA185
MDLDTRRLTSADWPQLWPFLLEMGTTGDEIDVRDRFAALIADPRWLLLGAASPASTLLGYAAAQDHGPHLRHGDLHRTARLHDLFVSRDARRQGVGRALMSTVAEWAAERVRYLEWQAHETRSAPFYERLGHRGEACPQPDYPTFEIDFHDIA